MPPTERRPLPISRWLEQPRTPFLVFIDQDPPLSLYRTAWPALAQVGIKPNCSEQSCLLVCHPIPPTMLVFMDPPLSVYRTAWPALAQAELLRTVLPIEWRIVVRHPRPLTTSCPYASLGMDTVWPVCRAWHTIWLVCREWHHIWSINL